jgi:hypothetical protein
MALNRTHQSRAILQCPVGQELARQASSLARESYGSDTMPVARSELLRAKNPYILACLTNVRAEFLGYFDVFPLKPDIAELFLSGGIAARWSGKADERIFSADDIFGANEIDLCTSLYIAGIAVPQPETYARRRHASMLVWGFWKYIESFYPPAHRREIFAVAATEAGENLLRKFHFSVRDEESKKPHKHPLYVVKLSPDVLRRAFESLPDWSASCQLSWAGHTSPRNPQCNGCGPAVAHDLTRPPSNQ